MADEADTPNAGIPATPEPLRVVDVARTDNGYFAEIQFNRALSAADLTAIRAALETERMPIPLPEMPRELTDPLVFLELNEKAMRMELALRTICLFAMGNVVLEGSGAVRDWLRDWINGITDIAGTPIHGPVGGPMLWPSAIPTAVRYLLGLGFTRSPQGYVVLKREPDAGERVQ